MAGILGVFFLTLFVVIFIGSSVFFFEFVYPGIDQELHRHIYVFRSFSQVSYNVWNLPN